VHYHCTGRAMERLARSIRQTPQRSRIAAFVSATGSAGTLAAGDYLKDQDGTRIVAVEALECPTLLYNGFGEHNIQGIGDKHVPFIHNVMNTDAVTAVSDRATDALNVLFNTAAGREYLIARRGVPVDLVSALSNLGLSSICNVVASIKTARHYDLGPDDIVVTVATDGAEMYASELAKTERRRFNGAFDQVHAAETYAQYLGAPSTDHYLELSDTDRRRIFNLGYFTWVEQQGVSVADFEARREQAFWRRQRDAVTEWDLMIADYNHRTGAVAAS
jgi:cysteine synthase